MIPITSQNRRHDSNLKERDPLLRPYNHATGKAVEKFTVHRFGKGDEFHSVGEATLKELIECHEDLMAGDSKGGK